MKATRITPDPFAPKDPRILADIKRWNKRLRQRGLGINRGRDCLAKIAATKKKRAIERVEREGRHTQDITVPLPKPGASTPAASAACQPKSHLGDTGPE